MELLLSFFSNLVRTYRTRRYLARKVFLTLPDGRKVSGRELLRYHELAERQLVVRQIYGAASGGAMCRIEFGADGSAVAEPMQKGGKA